MYALLTAIPYVGHLNPLLTLATELQRRGWRVAIASPTGAQAHVAAEAPGLPFVDLGPLGERRAEMRRHEEAASRDPDIGRGAFRLARSRRRADQGGPSAATAWPCGSASRGLPHVVTGKLVSGIRGAAGAVDPRSSDPVPEHAGVPPGLLFRAVGVVSRLPGRFRRSLNGSQSAMLQVVEDSYA